MDDPIMHMEAWKEAQEAMLKPLIAMYEEGVEGLSLREVPFVPSSLRHEDEHATPTNVHVETSQPRAHLNEFNSLFNQLTLKGLNLDDEMKTIFLLCSLPSSWDTFCMAISNLAPGGQLVFGDVTSSMLTKEIRRQSFVGTSKHGDVNVTTRGGGDQRSCTKKPGKGGGNQKQS
ncbi:hypothetical protein L7F22_014173 [Adiantum nelumboides]|nr:hypothetical protein [Adiantum nelumboides]